ncbi:MAG: flagellin [Alphaproteobacteria bacterium]
MSGIVLSSAMRANLLSLQNTSKLMDTTQERLSTGLKVNSAVQNPNAYFTASNLNNRASDLDALLDDMSQAVQTIKAADEGISAITTLVQQAKSQANTAATDKSSSYSSKGEYTAPGTAAAISFTFDGQSLTTAAPGSTSLADAATAIQTAIAGATGMAAGDVTVAVDGDKLKITSTDGKSHTISGEVGGLNFSGTADNSVVKAAQDSFNSILTQIDQLASDASYKGVNLLTGDDLKVIFNEDRSSSITVEGVDATTTGLGLSTADFTSASADIQASIDQADAAIKNLRSMSSSFSNAYSIVENREDFTENLINVLTDGADALTVADMNEESANMLALQTRQQLGVQALSIANQASQAVLSLF